jgi:hypothetical protein
MTVCGVGRSVVVIAASGTIFGAVTVCGLPVVVIVPPVGVVADKFDRVLDHAVAPKSSNDGFKENDATVVAVTVATPATIAPPVQEIVPAAACEPELGVQVGAVPHPVDTTELMVTFAGKLIVNAPPRNVTPRGTAGTLTVAVSAIVLFVAATPPGTIGFVADGAAGSVVCESANVSVPIGAADAGPASTPIPVSAKAPSVAAASPPRKNLLRMVNATP